MGEGPRKRQLRRSLGQRRRAVGRATGLRAAEQVARLLGSTPEFRGSARVVLYAALPDELPTAPLVARARAAGRPLLWPRRGPKGGLEFAACPDPALLLPGAWGVLAPPASSPALRLGPEDLVVVPGLAFDARGRRLGRGGGHYDRALPPPGARAPLLVGVGHGFQRVDQVPAGPLDRRVDWVVTDESLLRVATGSAPRASATVRRAIGPTP